MAPSPPGSLRLRLALRGRDPGASPGLRPGLHGPHVAFLLTSPPLGAQHCLGAEDATVFVGPDHVLHAEGEVAVGEGGRKALAAHFVSNPQLSFVFLHFDTLIAFTLGELRKNAC